MLTMKALLLTTLFLMPLTSSAFDLRFIVDGFYAFAEDKNETLKCTKCDSGAMDLALAKCTVAAAFTSPIAAAAVTANRMPHVGQFVAAFGAAVSPVCEGLELCASCDERKELEEDAERARRRNRIANRIKKDLRTAESAVDELHLNFASLTLRTFNAALADTMLHVGLVNLYQKTWSDLAANDLVFRSVEDVDNALFADLVTKDSTDRNLEFIVYTFSNMIRGQTSYFGVDREKFCHEEVVVALFKAQLRAREMLVYLSLIKAEDEINDVDNFAEEFAKEQTMQNRFVSEECRDFLEPISEVVEVIPKVKVKRPLRQKRQDDEEKASNDEDDEEAPHYCKHQCEAVTRNAHVICEGLSVFGANFICTALVLTGAPLACGVGVIVGSVSALSAFCASQYPARTNFCARCDEDEDDEIYAVLGNITSDVRNLTLSIQKINADVSEEKAVNEMKNDVKSGFQSLIDEHYVTNTYGKLLREIRFFLRRYDKLTFRESDVSPVEDAAFRRFVNRDSLIECLGLLSRFYTMVNGDSRRYGPFGVRALVDVAPEVFCKAEVIAGLETAQLKLIMAFNLLSDRILVQGNDFNINEAVKRWRKRQIQLVKDVCGKFSKNDGETDSLLAKFIAEEC